MKRFRLQPEARPSTVGYVALVKAFDCDSGRIVLNSKCSTDEYSTREKALRVAEQAASVVAWNMNAKRDIRPDGTAYRLKPC